MIEFYIPHNMNGYNWCTLNFQWLTLFPWHKIINSRLIIGMDFFKENRIYFIYFLIFGLWSSWRNANYNWSIGLYSICSMLIAFASYIVTFLINKFNLTMTLSTLVGNSAFLLILFVQSVISIETLIKTKSQQRFIEKFCSVDNLFNIKLGISVTYREEKRGILVKILILMAVLLLIKINIWAYTTYISEALEFFYCTMFFVHMVR